MSRFTEKLQTRCTRCRLRPSLCLCQDFPAFAGLRTELRLIIHRYEGNTTTNTGLLACEILPGSKVLWRGAKPGESEDPWIRSSELVCEGRTPLLLFPEDSAEVVDDKWVEKRRSLSPSEKFTLIVPDGSWRQARRVGRREPALAGMTRVTLPPGPPSEYRLRREPQARFVSTFEAIARVLGAIDGPQVRHELETIFRKFVGRHLWSRGDLEAHEVPGGIPESAIHERQVSGFPRRWNGSSV